MKYLIPVVMLVSGAYLTGLPLLFYAVVLHRDSKLEPFTVSNPRWVMPVGLDGGILMVAIFGMLLLLIGIYLSFRLLADDRKYVAAHSNTRGA